MAIRAWAHDFAPGSLALGRLLVGTVVLGLLLARRGWVRPTAREWALLAGCGVGWFGIYNVALNAAERHLDAGTTAMLVNVGPILIARLRRAAAAARVSRAGCSPASRSRSPGCC